MLEKLPQCCPIGHKGPLGPMGPQQPLTEIETHPVQVVARSSLLPARCPKVVTMKAYEVYCALYGEQKELVTDGCRGGFGTNELIAFLYAASFPRGEWRARVDEALTGMQGV